MKRFNEESYLVSKAELEVIEQAMDAFNWILANTSFGSLEQKLEFGEKLSQYKQGYNEFKKSYSKAKEEAEEVEFKELLGIYKGKYSLEEKKYYLEAYNANNRSIRATYRALKEELGDKAPGYETIRALVSKAKEAGYI